VNAEELVFVGFNSRVAALDRHDGTLIWQWKCPDSSGYVALMFDSDRLIVSVNGYMYCLNPENGQMLWRNSLKGFGTGVPSLASIAGCTFSLPGQAHAAVQQRRAAGS